MEIQKQQILDFFSYENDIFNPIESKHIRQLINKSGVILDDLFIDDKFQKVIFLLLEKNVFSPSNITEEQIEFAEILKITPSNSIIFEQLNQYLIFYMGYVQILLKGGVSNNILISTELENSRKSLPVYKIVNEEIEINYSNKLDFNNITYKQSIEYKGKPTIILNQVKNFSKSKLQTLLTSNHFIGLNQDPKNFIDIFGTKEISMSKRVIWIGSNYSLKVFLRTIKEHTTFNTLSELFITATRCFIKKNGNTFELKEILKANGNLTIETKFKEIIKKVTA